MMDIKTHYAYWKKISFPFRFEAGTSRGLLHKKDSWFIVLAKRIDQQPQYVGECSIIEGLSRDNSELIEHQLDKITQLLNAQQTIHYTDYNDFPSIQFALDALALQLSNQQSNILFNTTFIEQEYPLPINGLIWMGSLAKMEEQIHQKIAQGFSCIKMKVGAIDWKAELDLLKMIRHNYSAKSLSLRVDANGSFSPADVNSKLEALAKLDIHSIEQPLSVGHTQDYKELCKQAILPIALDEELIHNDPHKAQLLTEIMPQYIILKPSLLGGFTKSNEWIHIAQKLGIGWWITSALESNIGLNAIAQWTAQVCNEHNNTLPQGLGTGGLYTINMDSPLSVQNGYLQYLSSKSWDLSLLANHSK